MDVLTNNKWVAAHERVKLAQSSAPLQQGAEDHGVRCCSLQGESLRTCGLSPPRLGSNHAKLFIAERPITVVPAGRREQGR